MATNTDRINELEKAVATIINRLDHADARQEEMLSDHKESIRALTELRVAYEREIALLRREAEDMKKWKDEQKKEREEKSRRVWAFGPNVTAAVVTILLAPVALILWNYIAKKFGLIAP